MTVLVPWGTRECSRGERTTSAWGTRNVNGVDFRPEVYAQDADLPAIDAVERMDSNDPVYAINRTPTQSTRSLLMNWTGRPSCCMKTSIVVLSRVELSEPPMFSETVTASWAAEVSARTTGDGATWEWRSSSWPPPHPGMATTTRASATKFDLI